MASKATYQNMCPELRGKPWSVMSPSVFGIGQQNTPGLPCLRWDKYSPEKTCNKIMKHLEENFNYLQRKPCKIANDFP